MITRSVFSASISILCLVLLSAPAFTQDDNKKEDDKAKVQSITLKAERFDVVEEVTATVESKKMTPVTAKMDVWSSLEIQSIVPEGTAVKAGDQLIHFDTSKIDRKLQNDKFSLTQSEFALTTAKLEMELQEKTFGLDKQLADRAAKQAEEDFKYYQEVQKPNSIESAKRNVMNSLHSLEYAQEEFNQLKRMYDEDELTEESEEIILTRTKRDVENRQYYLKMAETRTDRQLNMEIPREESRQKDAAERARLVLARSQIALPMDSKKKKVAYEKAQVTLQQAKEDLQQLTDDRKRMKLSAPADGVLYYGQCERGKWRGQAGPSRSLENGKSVMPNKVVVTLVDVQNLMLRADLTEKQLGMVKANQKGIAKPTAFPGEAIAAQVTSVNYVPLASDKFDCQMDIGAFPSGLMPGMTCKVRFVVRSNENAIVVPTSALFTDDGATHYVFMKGGEKRTVRTGMESNKKTEILEGLSAGDEILKKRPAK